MAAFRLTSESKRIVESILFLAFSSLLYRLIVWLSNRFGISLILLALVVFSVMCLIALSRRISIIYSFVLLLVSVLLLPGFRLYLLIWDFGKMEFDSFTDLIEVNIATMSLFLAPAFISLILSRLLPNIAKSSLK